MEVVTMAYALVSAGAIIAMWWQRRVLQEQLATLKAERSYLLTIAAKYAPAEYAKLKRIWAESGGEP